MAEEVFRFADELGPEKILHIWEPRLGLKAIVVVDNTAAGPAIGGTRMAPDVSAEECFRLARAMTFKNAAAGLPHGGAKSVIFGDPSMPAPDKERRVRAFAAAIRRVEEYVPGPDMGTNETAMAWVKDEIGRCVGLPREVGGIPLDEIGATGLGLAVAAEAAQEFSGVRLEGARVAVQGFGAVGHHAARFLAARGARLVAASDSKGAVYDPKGLDIGELEALKARGGSLAQCGAAKKITAEDLIGVDCDIWIPAARPDVIREDNVDGLKARLVLQGANIPATPGAERRMHERGIHSIPDFIANAGGVIAASVEYHGGTEKIALDTIAEKIAANTRAVLDMARGRRILPREAAVVLARQRVERAMSLRRWQA
ncbi:MAG TPA: Glu/Leu/Phe/Val dehydrogenase [Hyphomicrobiaceae bacterium]|nr:Glu/Leu/Phe/Val dehydrogenase [Hyphomicrobiaceae bacterium]